MKLAYKLLILIIALVIMFCSLVVAFYSFSFTEVEFLPDLISEAYGRWDIGIVMIIAFIAGASIIYPVFQNTGGKKTTLISQTELGNINITLTALDNLIHKVAESQEGVKNIDTNIRNTEDGILISITAGIKSDLIIPELADNLQQKIKNYLEKTSGVNVSEVKILIKHIDDHDQQ
ncbi:MAG: alkaline shock response membrane anchor protein AmaP [Bacillota bacterium]